MTDGGTNGNGNGNGRHKQCSDLQENRWLGEYWEREFCKLAGERGRTFTRHQFRKSDAANAFSFTGGKYHSVLLPDITLWSAPGEHHEIKHKDPTRDGCFGLEEYRFNALTWFARETRQRVYYTIHNHKLAGGRDIKTNRIEDWMTISVFALEHGWEREGPGYSWCNSERKQVNILYWPSSLWIPLEDAWEVDSALAELGSEQQIEDGSDFYS